MYVYFMDKETEQHLVATQARRGGPFFASP